MADEQPPNYKPTDDLASDEWFTAELAAKIDDGTLEDCALVIRVLAHRMAHLPRPRSLDEISLYGDLGHALGSLTAAIAPTLRDAADDSDPEQAAFVETVLQRMDLAGSGLLEISGGWI